MLNFAEEMEESILKEEEDQMAFLFADFERMLLECKSDDKSHKIFPKSTEKYHMKTNPTPVIWSSVRQQVSPSLLTYDKLGQPSYQKVVNSLCWLSPLGNFF